MTKALKHADRDHVILVGGPKPEKDALVLVRFWCCLERHPVFRFGNLHIRGRGFDFATVCTGEIVYVANSFPAESSPRLDFDTIWFSYVKDRSVALDVLSFIANDELGPYFHRQMYAVHYETEADMEAAEMRSGQ